MFLDGAVSLFPVASPFMILLLIKTNLLRSYLGHPSWGEWPGPTRRLLTASDAALGGPLVILCWLTLHKEVSRKLVDFLNKEEKHLQLFVVSLQISLPLPNSFTGLIVSPEDPGSLLKLS